MRCPAGLSKQARDMWDHIEKSLEGTAILQNKPLLRIYAETYVQWKNATDSCHETPLVKQGSKVTENPLHQTADRLARKLESLIRLHGGAAQETLPALEDDSRLNDRQRQFVMEYLRDFSGPKAAVRAGYSAKGAASTSRTLLANDAVCEHIARMRRRMAEDVSVDFDDVLRGFYSEATGSGPDTTSASRITAWQQIARMKGFFESDNAQKTKGSKALEDLLAGMSPGEMKAMRQALRAQQEGDGEPRH